MSANDWYAVQPWPHKVPSATAVEDMARLQDELRKLPREAWSTEQELPDTCGIAILTACNHVHFIPDTHDNTGQKVQFYQARNFVRFYWGREAVGWRPLAG